MATVFIGVDPHKLSATIEVVDHRETALAAGRFGTDRAGYAAMRKCAAAWPDRTWAVEGSNGAGRPLAQRLLADGEQVVDVPAKLSARARLLDTGHNRKTDAHDVGTRPGLQTDGGPEPAVMRGGGSGPLIQARYRWQAQPGFADQVRRLPASSDLVSPHY